MKRFALLGVLLLAACASKPSRESLDRAREARLSVIRSAMTQAESSIHAAQMRLVEARKMKKSADKEAEIAAAEREENTYKQQKAALELERAKLEAEQRASELEGLDQKPARY